MKIFFLLLFLSSCALLNPNPNRKYETTKPVLRAFTTDYCSEWPNGVRANPQQWAGCCFTHDLHYWIGGTEEQRHKADEELKSCVKMSGNTLSSFLMYIGVRFGGKPGDASYSWGYGWTVNREYTPLSKEDILAAKALLEISAYNHLREQKLMLSFEKYLNQQLKNN